MPALFATNGRASRSGSQKLKVTFGVSSSPSVTVLSGSPRVSRYQAIARPVSRVGIEMKSTCSTRKLSQTVPTGIADLTFVPVCEQPGARGYQGCDSRFAVSECARTALPADLHTER